MARVRDIDIHEVPKEIQPIYQRYATEYGPFLNQVKVFAHRPPVLKHIMGLLLELNDEAVVPKRYLEIALVTVSTINKCEYCISHHAPRAVSHGLSKEALENILIEAPDGFDEVDILVRDFAQQVTSNFQYMRDAIFKEMKAHFTEEQIVELTMRIAMCGFFNRVNDSLQIENEEGVEHLVGMTGS